MPFGRFKGLDVLDLPDDYLRWLLENIELREPLLSAVQREQGHRRNWTPIKPSPTKQKVISVQPDQIGLVREIIESGYKVVARRKHPDVGGSDAEMIRLNLLAESLRNQLTALKGAY